MIETTILDRHIIERPNIASMLHAIFDINHRHYGATNWLGTADVVIKEEITNATPEYGNLVSAQEVFNAIFERAITGRITLVPER